MKVNLKYKKGARYYLFTPDMFIKSFYIHKIDLEAVNISPERMRKEYEWLADNALKQMNINYERQN